MPRVVAASRKWPRNGLSPGWLDCANGARHDEVEDPTPSRSMAEGREKIFSPAAPAKPRPTPEFKALSAFRQADKSVVTCIGTGYYAP